MIAMTDREVLAAASKVVHAAGYMYLEDANSVWGHKQAQFVVERLGQIGEELGASRARIEDLEGRLARALDGGTDR